MLNLPQDSLTPLIAKFEIDGPFNTGQIAQPSLYSTPCTIILRPVGTAPDAPQNAKDPW